MLIKLKGKFSSRRGRRTPYGTSVSHREFKGITETVVNRAEHRVTNDPFMLRDCSVPREKARNGKYKCWMLARADVEREGSRAKIVARLGNIKREPEERRVTGN